MSKRTARSSAGIFIIFIIGLASCTMGDAHMTVHATVVDVKGVRMEGCSASLHLSNEKYKSPPYVVQSEWQQGYTVAPRTKTYYVAITCPSGLSGKSRSFTYPQKEKVELLELGNIIVR